MSNMRPYGHHTVTASFIANGTGKVVSFLEKAFGAKVVDKFEMPDGSIMHAEILIGDTVLMCGEPHADWKASPGLFTLYLDTEQEVDAAFHRAVAAGAKEVEAPKDQPWGYRSASIVDPGGNRWTISTVIEVVSKEEIDRRMAKIMGGS